MANIKRFILSLLGLLMISCLSMAAPVAARDSSVSGDSSENSANQSGDQIRVHNLANSLKQQGEAELEAHKDAQHQQTEAQRQKACTARSNSLNKRMTRSVEQAKKHKAVFDKILTRVKEFHDTKKLNVPNYDALVTAAENAGANAQTSIDALQSLDINVDCSSQTVGASVSAFQQAVKNTRDSLKAYRSAITDLIKAVKGTADTSDNTSTNGGSQ